MVHCLGKSFWLLIFYLNLCSQSCRVLVIQWCTVLSSFPPRTLPSWRGALCVASAASWTIPLAFWSKQYFHMLCFVKTLPYLGVMWPNYLYLNWKTHLKQQQMPFLGAIWRNCFHPKPLKISPSYSSNFFNPNQALKFQGRLKYLHGQRENGTCNKPQLALFTIAMPVQPPSIVEIRAKMLLFQTKHKLDFTPMGIDSRCY